MIWFGASKSLLKPRYIASMVWPVLTVSTGCCAAGRQLVEHRVDLGVDLGQRFVGIVVEPQVAVIVLMLLWLLDVM